MRVLLVEPQYRRIYGEKEETDSPETATEQVGREENRGDERLWYPPLGLMKLARFHKNRRDEVRFVSGCNPRIAAAPDLFSQGTRWDRIYITTLFTFNWQSIIDTVAFYKEAVGGSTGKIFIGGIMASLMPEELYEETGVYPVTGLITSPKQIGLTGDENIDQLAPDYTILDRKLYAINETYYAYTSRGCVNRCDWCGVPRIETKYVPYVDIKPMIRELRKQYGDKPRLKLMDNNVLASRDFERIVRDLEELGYGRDKYTETQPRRQRVVDFNQGLDASFLDEERMNLIAKLNIKPMRIAFDRAEEEKEYVRVVRQAQKQGVTEFSNYMLYNWKDSPRDLYDRMVVNIKLNEEWEKGKGGSQEAEIYSYPMRFAPINSKSGDHANRRRDAFQAHDNHKVNWMKRAVWTKRFVRNIEIMKGAAHGAISPTSTLAWRTIGHTYDEFLANLYMPEELLRNRNKHEAKVHDHEPKRISGTGNVEEFRAFILKLLKKDDDRFQEFHQAVSDNSVDTVRKAMKKCKDEEILRWLQLYLKK